MDDVGIFEGRSSKDASEDRLRIWIVVACFWGRAFSAARRLCCMRGEGVARLVGGNLDVDESVWFDRLDLMDEDDESGIVGLRLGGSVGADTGGDIDDDAGDVDTDVDIGMGLSRMEGFRGGSGGALLF